MRMRRIPHQQAQRSKATHYFVPASVDQAALPQRAGQHGLCRVDQPPGAVADDQQRWAQTAVTQVLQEAAPGVGALAPAGRQPDQDRLAHGGDAPRGQHRLGPGAGVQAKARAVQEQIVQFDVVQATLRQASNSVLIASQTRETVDLERVASAPSASASVCSTSRTLSPRTNPAMTSDSNALVLVTPVPNRREAKRSLVPRSFGRCTVTGPVVVFTVVGQ
jgi:hypothetical protein